MKKLDLLVIEDAPEHRAVIESALSADYDVEFAVNGAEAIAKLEQRKYKLFLIDVVLPDMDGFKICSIIRSQESTKNIPIIFVTAKEEIPDKVMAFNLGADDYITKPFDILELKVRVKAKLRSYANAVAERSKLARSGIEIDLSTQKVNIPEAKIFDLTLTKIEYNLLVYMMSNCEMVLSREQILDAVWGDKLNVSDRTIDAHVSKLRKKLGRFQNLIESVHGTGYRFKDSHAKASA